MLENENKQTDFIAAVQVAASIFESQMQETFPNIHADLVVPKELPEDENENFDVVVEITGIERPQTASFGFECSHDPQFILDCLKQTIAPQKPEWHLSPSQKDQLEAKIKEYVAASIAAGYDADEEEVFDNIVIGTLDNEIGELNDAQGEDDYVDEEDYFDEDEE
ncbi:MAG: hypothetical protein NC218_02085 [Acetobacter sp.]|nr:hypothetical protein [Acetobacter sp.]